MQGGTDHAKTQSHECYTESLAGRIPSGQGKQPGNPGSFQNPDDQRPSGNRTG